MLVLKWYRHLVDGSRHILGGVHTVDEANKRDEVKIHLQAHSSLVGTVGREAIESVANGQFFPL